MHKLRGLSDNELVSITLTGREIKFIEAALRFITSEPNFKDPSNLAFLEKISKKLKEYIK